MKHFKRGKTFGRVRGQRTALAKVLVRALIQKEKILTTEAKAKSLRPAIEKMVTKAKAKNLPAIRQLAAFLDQKSTKKLVETISPRYQTRPGGYTRIIKVPPRKSDGSPMAIIEFVK